MSLRPCPVCGGARLRAESRAVLVGGHARSRSSARSRRGARCEWLGEVELSETDRHVARLILREISERLQFLENVGIGYLSMDRAAATLSGGEAQRIRLATQIGSSLVGVLYILDEPSIGLHQRDNAKLIGDARAAARPRQHGDRGRARRADDARRRPPRRPRPGRGRARRADRRAGHRRARSSACTESLTGQYLSGARAIEVPDAAAHAERLRRDPRRQPSTTCATSTCASRSACSTCVTGVSGSGKSTLVNDVLYKARRQPPAPRAPASGRAPRDPRPRAARQDHRRRPVADRAHAALEPGDLHGPVRRDPRPLLEDAGGARARLQAGALLASTSRAGAARSAAATARSRSRCTSCRTSTCRASSATASATTARRSRSASRARPSPTCSTCRSRRRSTFFEHIPKIRRRLETLERRRPRLHAPRPAGDDALGRRGAARQARDRALEDRDRPHAVHPRRADDGPALRRRRSGCSRCCSGSSTPATPSS